METRTAWKARMGIGARSSVPRLTGGPGTTRTTRVPRDDAPGVAGTATDHWDGRRDATAHGTAHITPTGRAALTAARATKERP